MQENLDDEMDHEISEVERSKRLENLMEKRRLSKFQIIRNAKGMGVGSGQISSLNIPKKNPFLLKSSGEPGSAPTYMIKNNPFDLPYDPHEEKPILTGDTFKDEFMATHHKEPRCETPGLSPPQSINETYFDTDFVIKHVRRLGGSKVGKRVADKKQSQETCLIPNLVTDDNHAIEEGESFEKVVDHTKEHEVDRDVASTDQSASSSSSSEDDEPILRPNKEAILHCLSMSRMRVISQGNSFRRNAESFDCGPSSLFDKSKTDCFFFGSNKRVPYGSTNSVASYMQVEVSEVGSPSSTNMSSLDEEGKGSLVNSTNPSELDLNEVRLRDIDELSEQDTSDP
ncbi:hypothetical protein L1987_37241 [Smallanthus sonchifolius]|uniref:Uncharacterized protein n=1 Tax=Smallanthus sonchifolius TaxID=185202 RepID=A0ACB9HFN2_9ASTR|nr:hypothetical protein L1987_37241 [Smallanthus sonchifolius]